MGERDDDGFAPMDDGSEVQPLGPSRRRRDERARGGGCLKGCLVTLAVLALLAVIGVYACGKVLERSVIEEPAEIEAVARAVGQFALPPGFVPEGALRLPRLGQVAVFLRDADAGSGAAAVAVGRIDVELDPEDLVRAMSEASGQGARDARASTRPCQVAGRPALCLEAVTTPDDGGARVRWQGVLVPGGASTAVAAMFDEEQRFDPALAQAFLDSFAPR